MIVGGRKTGKSFVIWQTIKTWCLAHSRQRAAIVTSDGHFDVRFVPCDKPTPHDRHLGAVGGE